MKKTKVFAMLTTVLAMGLAACNGKSSSAAPAESSNTPASSESTPAATTSAAPASSQNSAQSSNSASAQSSNSASASSAQTQEGQMAATGIDILAENNKVYAKVTGTISGFANAAAMKMAFGLVSEAQQGSTGTYILGSAEPADADYNLVPTVDATAGTFELKVDLSNVQWVGGTYTAMVGPKGFYAAVASTGGTYGTGQAKAGGFRISIRSHNGTIAADALPPVALTISRIETTADKVFHIIGGALDTTVLSEADFLAKHPYVQYEGTTGQWGKNVLGSSTKTDLVTVSVENGNALIKTDITSLTANGYNIKINLNGDSDVDTKMDAIIDERNNPVPFGMYDYAVYADSTKTAKSDLYGNCGLFITNANRYVNAGEKIADLQPVKSKEGEIAYEMVAEDCVGQNAPVYGTADAQKNTRLGKGGKLTDVWEINGIKSGEYEVYVKGAYSSGNGTSYWSGAQNVEHAQDPDSEKGNNKTNGTYNPAARYKVNIDTAEAVDLASDKTYDECGLVGANGGGWTNAAMARVVIPDGSTTFTMTSNNNGYAIWVFAIRLVRVGNYVRPATEAAFTDGVMRVEAEAYHEASAEPTIKTEGGDTYLEEVGGWPQFNASFKINFAEAKHVKLKLRYNWTTAQFGKYGAAELTMDGSNTKIRDASGVENLGQSEDGPQSTWMTTESQEFDIDAGVHTFKLQTPGGCKVSWDYFELIVVPQVA